LTQPVRGQHLVRPDGTVGVGIYGPVLVAGKTLGDARTEIARAIHARLDPKGKVSYKDVLDGLSVDVLAYNSSVYYIITDGAGLGEQVYRFPITGSETVLDAISHINGLPLVACKRRIWVARRNPGHPGPDTVLPVDWIGVTQVGAMNTNWQVMPGDRIYVQADKMRTFNNNLSKFLEPVERLLGVTLLGSQTVNSIRSGTTSTIR
jgi:polysaccharide export outer membrane protein